MKESQICFGNICVPVIYEDDIRYFPASYISVKVMLRPNKNGVVNNGNKDKLKDHIRKFTISFDSDNIQECRCISEEGLKLSLLRTQQSRLSNEQKESQNHIHKYLGIPLLPLDYEKDSEVYKGDWFDEHDSYTNEIIKYEINNIDDLIFRQCSKCLKHYPLSKTFYRPDKRSKYGHVAKCIVCDGKRENFRHYDDQKDYDRKIGFDSYEDINLEYIENLYQAYLDGRIKRIPDSFLNKESFFKIMDYLLGRNKINKSKFTYNKILIENKLEQYRSIISNKDIFSHFFGEYFYLYPWRYPSYRYPDSELTYGLANKILRNYMAEFNIIVNNPLIIDYGTLLTRSKLSKFNTDTLYFAVQFNEFRYAGYQFSTKAKNYYTNEKNVLFDLKFLIEKDMKVEVNKIPLYLTKNVLHLKANPLYYYIVTKKNHSIYYWINKLYPNKFIEMDFDINPYRSTFDSDIESFVHEVLKKEIPNLIYNPRDSEHTIKINGKIPDWFAFTDSGAYIIEYFGLFSNTNIENSRIKMYRNKMKSKLEAYKEVGGYKFLFLYPDDTVNDFKGVKDKIKKMKEDKNFTML